MAAVRYCRRPFAGATAATAVDMAATMVATASAWGWRRPFAATADPPGDSTHQDWRSITITSAMVAIATPHQISRVEVVAVAHFATAAAAKEAIVAAGPIVAWLLS